MTRPRPRRWRRVPLALLVAAVALLAGGRPAAADPPGPTNFRSTVDAIVPDVEGIEVSIVGGDGFLLLEVASGHTVEVPGYSGEPYLRFAADGTVEENTSSPAYDLNQSRGRTDTSADADAEPTWRVVATDGRWAWHDHRVHYMGSGDPAPDHASRGDGLRWTVPIVVDGTEVEVQGRYVLLAAPSPLPWFALAAVVAAAVVLGLTRLIEPVSAAGTAVLASGVFAVAAGWAQRGADPPGAPTSPLVVVLPVVAVIAGVIAVMQRGRVLRAVAALAGAAAAGGWALVRLAHLWTAVLPTTLDPALDRAAVAVALGATVAAATLVVRSGALAAQRVGPPPEVPGASD